MMLRYLLIAALLTGCSVDFGKKESTLNPPKKDEHEEVPVEKPPEVAPPISPPPIEDPPDVVPIDPPDEDPELPEEPNPAPPQKPPDAPSPGNPPDEEDPVIPKAYYIDIWWNLYHPYGEWFVLEVWSNKEKRSINVPIQYSGYKYITKFKDKYCANVWLVNRFGPLSSTGVFCGESLEYAEGDNKGPYRKSDK